MNHEHLAWYAIYIRPQFENVVTSHLSRKGIETFLPTCRSLGKPGEHRHPEAPLFPNYVFCQIHSTEVRSLLMVPGVLHIVGTASGVKPVDDDEMAAIQRIAQAGLQCQPCRFLASGPWVRVADGVLRNLKGILADSRNGVGIVIGISLLQRAVLVELGEATRIVPISHTGTVLKTTVISSVLPDRS